MKYDKYMIWKAGDKWCALIIHPECKEIKIIIITKEILSFKLLFKQFGFNKLLLLF